MVGLPRALRLTAAALVVSGGLLVASCGGGSVATTPLPQPSNAPAAYTLPAGGGSTTFAATSNGQYATLSNTAYPGTAVTVTGNASTTAPASAPSLSSVLRRSTESVAGAVPFYWVSFSVSAAFSTQYLSSFGVSLASNDPATGQYYIEFDDVTSSPATKLGDAGPGTVANGFVTVSTGGGGSSGGNNGNSSQTLQPGHTYLAQFFYFPAGTPIPTPSGGGSPTPSPSPTASATSHASASPSPSGSASPTASPTGSASSSPSPSPSGSGTPGPTSPPNYTFNGTFSSTAVSPNATPSPIVMSVYGGVGFSSIQWPETISGSDTLNMADATGSGDITPSGFPLYTGSGTAIIYLKVGTQNGTTVDFPSTPTFSLTDQANPGAGCAFFGYINNGGPYTWTQVAPSNGSAPVTISNGTYVASIPSVSAASVGGQIDLSGSGFYGAVICQ